MEGITVIFDMEGTSTKLLWPPGRNVLLRCFFQFYLFGCFLPFMLCYQQLHVDMSTLPASANVKTLVGFCAPTVQALADVPQMGTRGSLNKKASSL